jgi:four helix bundle protein
VTWCGDRVGGTAVAIAQPVTDSEQYFPHDRLQVFGLAVELAQVCDRIVRDLPKGYSKIGDNLLRSSQGIPLLIGEGANRSSDAQKRQRFGEARGEAGECAAALQLLVALGVVADGEPSRRGLEHCYQLGAMLTKLVQRLE